MGAWRAGAGGSARLQRGGCRPGPICGVSGGGSGICATLPRWGECCASVRGPWSCFGNATSVGHRISSESSRSAAGRFCGHHAAVAVRPTRLLRLHDRLSGCDLPDRTRASLARHLDRPCCCPRGLHQAEYPGKQLHQWHKEWAVPDRPVHARSEHYRPSRDICNGRSAVWAPSSRGRPLRPACHRPLLHAALLVIPTGQRLPRELPHGPTQLWGGTQWDRRS